MHAAKTILFTIVNDCRTYFDEYFYNGTIIGAVMVLLYCIILLCKFICVRKNMRNSFFSACIKIPFIALLGFYCYLLLGITLLSRNKEAEYILRLVPFSTWDLDIFNVTLWIENILMMIPLGILLYIIWAPFRKLGWSILAGFLCSLSIECIQLFTRLGKFETDDIMNNVLGVVIGFLGCKVVGRVFDRDSERSRHL